MDAVDAAGAVLVDLVDGVLDARLLEAGLLAGHVGVEGLLVEGVGEDPVLGDDLAELAGHDAAVAAEGHVDGGGLIQDGHDAHVHGHPDASVADGLQPVLELVHIPAQLGHDVVRALVLLLLEEADVRLQGAAGDVSLRGAGHGDGELLAELRPHELDKLGGVVQVAAGAGPAEGQVAPQGQHVVDAVVQIGLELVLHALPGVADAGEVGDGDALAVLGNLVKDLQVLAHVGPARAVGAGDVVGVQGVELLQHAARAAQLLHAGVGLGGEHLKGKRGSLFKNVGYAHG